MLTMTNFAVDQEIFSGPLAVLLELIEKQQLEITKVSLAKVTEEYLDFLQTHDVPADELSDFLLTASRLIYIKSRELMPYLRLSEEDEAADKLEDQLRLYREYAAAARQLEAVYLKSKLFVRPYIKPKTETVMTFIAPTNLSIAGMKDIFGSLLKRLQPFFALSEVSLERTKSVQERLDELTEALRSRASMSFHEILQGTKSKPEVIVSFLALLELLRRRVIRAEQSGIFSDIQLKRVG
jgi:segregation and condensation protein A